MYLLSLFWIVISVQGRALKLPDNVLHDFEREEYSTSSMSPDTTDDIFVPKYDKKFSFDQFEKDYSIVRFVGSGTYGDVFEGLYQPAGKPSVQVAIKFFKNDGEDVKREVFIQEEFWLNENGGLRRLDLKNKYMIRAFAYFNLMNDPYRSPSGKTAYYHAIVYEYMPASLSGFVKESTSPNFQRYKAAYMRVIFFKLVEALYFFELNGFIHCDLKPANVLINDRTELGLAKNKNIEAQIFENVDIKIIDFGMISQRGHQRFDLYRRMQFKYGTGRYRAPEVYMGGYTELDTKLDVWSIGVSLFELALGHSFFGGFGKPNQYMVPVLQLLYFGKNKVYSKPSDLPKRLMTLPGSAGIIDDYRRVVLDRKYKNSLEHELMDSYRDENFLTEAESVLPHELLDLLMQLCHIDPKKRISAGDALAHTFFTKRLRVVTSQ